MTSTPAGLSFARAALAIAISGKAGVRGAMEIASDRWGATSYVASMLKSAVAAGASGNVDWAPLGETGAISSEFLAGVHAQALIGRLPLRRVPPRTPVVAISTGATSYWTAEGAGKPVSSMAFSRVTIELLKIACLVVLADDLVRNTSAEAETLIRNDMIASMAALTDQTFVDPSNAGIAGIMPASITHGVPPIPSSGADAASVRADLGALFGSYSGDWTSAALIMHPSVAIALGLQDVLSTADLSVRGGVFCGVPVFCSSSVPTDSSGSAVILLDCAAVLLAEGSVAALSSNQGAVEMETAPAGSATVPTATQMISLFQTNSTAIVLERRIAWEIGRPGAVAWLSNVAWGSV